MRVQPAEEHALYWHTLPAVAAHYDVALRAQPAWSLPRGGRGGCDDGTLGRREEEEVSLLGGGGG